MYKRQRVPLPHVGAAPTRAEQERDDSLAPHRPADRPVVTGAGTFAGRVVLAVSAGMGGDGGVGPAGQRTGSVVGKRSGATLCMGGDQPHELGCAGRHPDHREGTSNHGLAADHAGPGLGQPAGGPSHQSEMGLAPTFGIGRTDPHRPPGHAGLSGPLRSGSPGDDVPRLLAPLGACPADRDIAGGRFAMRAHTATAAAGSIGSSRRCGPPPGLRSAAGGAPSHLGLATAVPSQAGRVARPGSRFPASAHTIAGGHGAHLGQSIVAVAGRRVVSLAKGTHPGRVARLATHSKPGGQPGMGLWRCTAGGGGNGSRAARGGRSIGRGGVSGMAGISRLARLAAVEFVGSQPCPSCPNS